MVTKDLLKKVRRIQIYTSHVVNDILSGAYRSTFKGRGIEFDEVREYNPGDDVRTIDWNVTARIGRPFVKKFVEERELTVMLVVDASSSGQFGSKGQLKNELAAEVCATLAFSAIKNDDKVGLVIFTDRVEKYIPPKKGKRHVLCVIREVLSFTPEHTGTDISAGIEFFNSISKKRTVTFLVSDFAAKDYERSLMIANRRHDIIAVVIKDRREREFPRIGMIELEDAETGEPLLVDSSDDNFQKGIKAFSGKADAERDRFLKRINVDAIYLETGEPYIESFMRFFRIREKRK